MTINHRRSQRCSCNVPFPCPEKSKVEGRRSTSKPLFAHQGEQLYLYLRVFGFEFRLLCRVAQPLKLWLGRVSVRTSEEGVRVRAARKLLKKQKPKCESNHYVHLSRPENCSECRCWLSESHATFYHTHLMAHILVCISSDCQSVSQPVGTSVSQLGRFDVQRGSLYANWRLFVTPTQRSSQRLSPRRVGNCNSSTFEFTFEQRLRAQIITVIAACWSRRHPVGRSSYYYYYNCSCIFYQWIECCTHMRASRQPPLHPLWSSSVTRKT